MGEIHNDPDLRDIAEGMAEQARAYLTTTTQVASGAAPGAVLPLLLLALSDALAAGARLGAVGDVVPVPVPPVGAGPLPGATGPAAPVPSFAMSADESTPAWSPSSSQNMPPPRPFERM